MSKSKTKELTESGSSKLTEHWYREKLSCLWILNLNLYGSSSGHIVHIPLPPSRSLSRGVCIGLRLEGVATSLRCCKMEEKKKWSPKNFSALNFGKTLID